MGKLRLHELRTTLREKRDSSHRSYQVSLRTGRWIRGFSVFEKCPKNMLSREKTSTSEENKFKKTLPRGLLYRVSSNYRILSSGLSRGHPVDQVKM
jgi:hypothetical protein